MAQRTVQDLVQARNTVVVSPHTSLAEALLLCRDNGIHRLPVVREISEILFFTLRLMTEKG